jgi:hypothetical protein
VIQNIDGCGAGNALRFRMGWLRMVPEFRVQGLI